MSLSPLNAKGSPPPSQTMGHAAVTPAFQTLYQQAGALPHATPQDAIAWMQQASGLDNDAFVRWLGQALHYPVMCLADMLHLSADFSDIPYRDALQHTRVCLKDAQRTFFVFADIFDERCLPWAMERIPNHSVITLTHRDDIAALLARHEENTRTIPQAIAQMAGEQKNLDAADELSLNRIEGDASVVVRLVRSTLYDALKAEASDIHLETNPEGMVIKYRLDGVLSQAASVQEPSLAEQVVSRIKVMAELDITEQRIPQDGRFRAVYRGRDVDFRVSIMPSIHGEDVVIRVLDKQSLADQAKGLRLDVLGFDPMTMEALRTQFKMPFGMVLVTGPTGSGKTTTLYAAISEINHGGDKIITIEDPVEYQLPGVLQIPVNEKKGLTFARGLRSILRHDPDRIMVGEIRDAETAQIAVQSALTGHLVLTTVHANNVFDVLGRFLNMGVDTYSFVSALNIVVAQRLLRTLCPLCTEPAPMPVVKRPIDIPKDALLLHGRGCRHCRGTGFKGRRAVAEVLLMDDEMRELIVQQAPIRQIKALAVAKGTLFLSQAALQLAFAGKTTIEEVMRVAPTI